MTTSSATCIGGDEIDPALLGALLHALAASDETALADTDYFDPDWAWDVPNAPQPSDDSRDDAVGGRRRHANKHHRIVAVVDGAYIGFLAGRLDPKSAFISLLAALHPGEGVGPKLLEQFTEMAIAEGRTQLRLVVDSGGNRAARIEFFENQGFVWCDDEKTIMRKPLVEARAAGTS